MLLQLLQPSFPDIKFKILHGLDKASTIKCRSICRDFKRIIDQENTFEGYLSDRKLRRRRSPLRFVPKISSTSTSSSLLQQQYELELLPLDDDEMSMSFGLVSYSGFKIKKLIIGKLMHSLKNVQMDRVWESVEEIEFTRAITSRNYHAILKTCAFVKIIRVNYLAVGGKEVKSNLSIIRSHLNFFKKPPDEDKPIGEYHLPNLKAIYLDRALDTAEFIDNRNKNKFKYFNADLYFKTMALLIDDLEKEVHDSILEMLRTQLRNRTADDPNAGFFFTKPLFVNRFPMTTRVLNRFSYKLRQ